MPAVATQPHQEQALAVRMRPDLRIVPQRFAGQRYWAVKDPVALRYFHLRDEEHFILRLLNGAIDFESIRTLFERRFAPQRLPAAQLQAFLARLYEDGLVIVAAAGQGGELLARRTRSGRRELTGRLAGIFSIRFRGIDPQRFVNWLYGWVQPAFSPWCVAACALLVAAAVLLCLVQSDTLLARLPDFQGFFNPRNALLMAAALAVTKVLHELGHALACKHFGGECHELGVMLLVFTPCLYCNVSDAWMLPDKWRRIAISAAGMYVELVLAAVCTFLWWFSEPGLLNSLSLNLVFVCSISTLLFNGNPLLRYDGYYILADLTETPNLAQQSTAIVQRAVARHVFGLESFDGRLLNERGQWWLACYAIASWAYRLFLLGAILWFLHRVLEPYGAQSVVQALAVVALFTLFLKPVVMMATFLADPRQTRKVAWKRTSVWGLGVLALGALVALAPLPHRIAAPAVVEPAQAQRVYVTVPGTLVMSAQPGDAVAGGQVIARLENLELDLEIARLRGERDEQHRHLQNLERRRVQDPAAAALIPTARESLADSEERLKQRLLDQARLELTAPTAGTVLSPHRRDAPVAADELPAWTGTPLDPRNRGGLLETGTLLCLIGDPDRNEAVLVVDQSDVEYVAPGQRVRMQFELTDGRTLWGTVREVARLDLKVAPRELIEREDLPVRMDETGVARPAAAVYQARVEFDQPTPPLLSGAPGRAKIHAAPMSLGRRLARYLERTFRFRL
jgi:putative peptide zinc metalloprotease protein